MDVRGFRTIGVRVFERLIPERPNPECPNPEWLSVLCTVPLRWLLRFRSKFSGLLHICKSSQLVTRSSRGHYPTYYLLTAQLPLCVPTWGLLALLSGQFLIRCVQRTSLSRSGHVLPTLYDVRKLHWDCFTSLSHLENYLSFYALGVLNRANQLKVNYNIWVIFDGFHNHIMDSSISVNWFALLSGATCFSCLHLEELHENVLRQRINKNLIKWLKSSPTSSSTSRWSSDCVLLALCRFAP